MTTAALVTHLGPVATYVTLGLIVGFILFSGLVIILGRTILAGSFKARANGPDEESSGAASPDLTVIRSWLAIVLVGGLLIFAAVSFQLDDTALRSSLMGGVIASAGAAAAFYFASKASDQARQDILNAALATVTVPSLTGKTSAEVNATLAGVPLYLMATPANADPAWIAESQDPLANQQVPTGSRIAVTFAAPPQAGQAH